MSIEKKLDTIIYLLTLQSSATLNMHTHVVNRLNMLLNLQRASVEMMFETPEHLGRFSTSEEAMICWDKLTNKDYRLEQSKASDEIHEVLSAHIDILEEFQKESEHGVSTENKSEA